MNVTREASSDTRALVETFLEQDAEFAELIGSGASVTLPASVGLTLFSFLT